MRRKRKSLSVLSYLINATNGLASARTVPAFRGGVSADLSEPRLAQSSAFRDKQRSQGCSQGYSQGLSRGSGLLRQGVASVAVLDRTWWHG